MRRRPWPNMHGLLHVDECVDGDPRELVGRTDADRGGPGDRAPDRDRQTRDRWLQEPRRRRAVPTSGIVRRTSAALFRHPRLKLWLTLGPTAAWMLVIYLASLALMLVTAFWRLNELSSQIERVWGLQNFQTLANSPVYPHDHDTNGRHGDGRDDHGPHPRAPDRVLRRSGGGAPDALAPAARRRDAVVVELPGACVRVEGDHGGRRAAAVVPPAAGHPSQHLGQQLGRVAHVLLPLAAVRHPPDLRSARALAGLPAWRRRATWERATR